MCVCVCVRYWSGMFGGGIDGCDLCTYFTRDAIAQVSVSASEYSKLAAASEELELARLPILLHWRLRLIILVSLWPVHNMQQFCWSDPTCLYLWTATKWRPSGWIQENVWGAKTGGVGYNVKGSGRGLLLPLFSLRQQYLLTPLLFQLCGQHDISVWVYISPVIIIFNLEVSITYPIDIFDVGISSMVNKVFHCVNITILSCTV